MNDEILQRCGLNENVTPMWTMAEDIQGYAGAGFGGIGIWLHKFEKPYFEGFWLPGKTIPPEVIASTSQAILQAGLKVSHIAVAGFYTEPNREERIAHTLHGMDIAAALGAECLQIAPGRTFGRTYGEAQDVAARVLTEVFERTAQPNVRLALEPIVPWQSDYLNTLGEAMDLIDLVGHPNLGVYVDTFHLWRTGTLLEDIERAGSLIFGVDLNDAVSDDDQWIRLPGEGQIPLAQVVRAIEATGYQGTYDSEYMYDPALISACPDDFAPEVVVRRCAEAMVKVLDGNLTFSHV